MKAERRYEPEIDGLRALAVLLVVLFHAGFKGWRGGFIGVDIFFVISGYLISRNIFDDLEQQRFSFKTFYFRRARRIFPAMFAIMAASLLAGFLLFSPVDLRALGQSALAGAAGVQNIFFWHETGYWDLTADHKPLLHYWSLAVEEQFYLAWPLLLVGLHRLGPHRRLRKNFCILLLISLVSLAASQYWLQRDAMASFYLTPFRAFEFGLGALLLPAAPAMARLPNAAKEAALAVALAGIAVAVKKYSEAMPFPGVAALLPCGAAALIVAARSARYSGWLFRNRLATGIGLISYSLYLVHWPLLVFAKYARLNGLTRVERYEVIALSLLLAWLSYRFVEQPFRRPQFFNRFTLKPLPFFTCMIALLIALAVPAAYAWKSPVVTHGMSADLLTVAENAENAHAARTAFVQNCLAPRTGACARPAGGKNFAVLGDSFGEDFAMGVFRAYPQDRVTLYTQGGCKALIDPAPQTPVCKRYTDALFAGPHDWAQYDAVILAMAWDADNIAPIKATAAFFHAHGAKRLVLVGPRIRLKIPAPQIIERCKTLDEYRTLSAQEMDLAAAQKLETAMRAVAMRAKMDFVPLTQAECPAAACPDLVPGTLMPMIWDTGHLTMDGAAYIVGRTKADAPL